MLKLRKQIHFMRQGGLTSGRGTDVLGKTSHGRLVYFRLRLQLKPIDSRSVPLFTKVKG